jgi:hypothetical protein
VGTKHSTRNRAEMLGAGDLRSTEFHGDKKEQPMPEHPSSSGPHRARGNVPMSIVSAGTGCGTLGGFGSTGSCTARVSRVVAMRRGAAKCCNDLAGWPPARWKLARPFPLAKNLTTVRSLTKWCFSSCAQCSHKGYLNSWWRMRCLPKK